MASRTLPGGLGLSGFWTLGDKGYKDQMDANLLWLSVLAGGAALDLVAAEPGSPTEGQVYILDETHATNANQIAVYDDGGWKYKAVPAGRIMYLADEAAHRWFDGTVWTLL